MLARKLISLGQDAMAAAMARQKRHALAFEHSEHDGVRRIAKRRLDANLARVRQTGHGIQPAAADDSDLGLRGRDFRVCDFLIRLLRLCHFTSVFVAWSLSRPGSAKAKSWRGL